MDVRLVVHLCMLNEQWSLGSLNDHIFLADPEIYRNVFFPVSTLTLLPPQVNVSLIDVLIQECFLNRPLRMLQCRTLNCSDLHPPLLVVIKHHWLLGGKVALFMRKLYLFIFTVIKVCWAPVWGIAYLNAICTIKLHTTKCLPLFCERPQQVDTLWFVLPVLVCVMNGLRWQCWSKLKASREHNAIIGQHFWTTFH